MGVRSWRDSMFMPQRRLKAQGSLLVVHWRRHIGSALQWARGSIPLDSSRVGMQRPDDRWDIRGWRVYL
jgi:hypothetical protein